MVGKDGVDMSAFLAVLGILSLVAIPVLGIIFIALWISKKPKKPIGIAMLACLAVFIVAITVSTTFPTADYATATPTLEPTPTQTEGKEDYMKSCEEIDWEDLARYPDQYAGQRIKVTGQVSQIIDGGWLSDGGYRVYEDYDILTGDTWLKKEWYMEMDSENASPRILKDDVIAFYVEFAGTTEIVRALTGTTDEVVALEVAYYTIQE